MYLVYTLGFSAYAVRRILVLSKQEWNIPHIFEVHLNFLPLFYEMDAYMKSQTFLLPQNTLPP